MRRSPEQTVMLLNGAWPKIKPYKAMYYMNCMSMYIVCIYIHIHTYIHTYVIHNLIHRYISILGNMLIKKWIHSGMATQTGYQRTQKKCSYF